MDKACNYCITGGLIAMEQTQTTNQRKLRLLTNQEMITRKLINTLRRDMAKTRKKIISASVQVSMEKQRNYRA